jgi:predicted metal-dependent peptidase
MFSGLLVPKRKDYNAIAGCLLDTSASMSKDDLTYGVSQLQGLDERAEIWLTCCDAEVYWDKTLKIRNINSEELSKIKPVGRGGTILNQYVNNYEKHIGKCDFLIIITDGAMLDTDVAAMQNPGIPVYWILTAYSSFNAPFGKVFELRA